MAFSVGFRAPKQRELLDNSFLHYLFEYDAGQLHYADPDLQPAELMTEIDARAVFSNSQMNLKEGDR